METSVVAAVESPWEPLEALRIRMLGPLTIDRGGQPLALPASRKVRALFAYLALAPRPVLRGQLCELLWDVPNDPRGELRWCLSKIRSFADDPGRRRIQTSEDSVRLDVADCRVDAMEVIGTMGRGCDMLTVADKKALLHLFQGEFLEGLEVDRSPAFGVWLGAQRRRFRAWHLALLEQVVASATQDDAVQYLERWLQVAPYDSRPHEIMLALLGNRGRIPEGEAHLTQAVRLFEAEGLDAASLRQAWRASLRQPAGPAPAQAVSSTPAEAEQVPNEVLAAPARRASIAVMPFEDQSATKTTRGGAADALTHDVITRLAKLRCLFVIAQGTVFALQERRVASQEAGSLLKVDYVVSGSLRRDGKRLGVMVELAETASGRIVWSEAFNHRTDDALLLLDEIGNRIVASVASEIETVERNRAVLKPPNSLDAWEAYHRGLWHMYRFSKQENEHAQHFFETAVRLDPTFSRAYAGLSFTHWQSAFQGWSPREHEINLAFAAAGQSLMADERDPAAHWAMGRAIWLSGHHERSVVELERAVDLSPNFALGHYTLAFVHSLTGDPRTAISSADHSRHLSPFDPLLFGMLASRAAALVRLGQFEEAAGWAVKAAGRPNAHPHIQAIAAFSLALAGSLEEARTYAAAVRRAVPGYGMRDFLGAFRLETEGAALFRKGAGHLGMT